MLQLGPGLHAPLLLELALLLLELALLLLELALLELALLLELVLLELALLELALLELELELLVELALELVELALLDDELEPPPPPAPLSSKVPRIAVQAEPHAATASRRIALRVIRTSLARRRSRGRPRGRGALHRTPALSAPARRARRPLPPARRPR